MLFVFVVIRLIFIIKVRVYDTEYQPACPSLNKKTAKAASATVALQALGLVPRN